MNTESGSIWEVQSVTRVIKDNPIIFLKEGGRMKIKLCSSFIILAFLLALTTLAVSAPSACVTSSGKVGRWFGTPGNMKCAGPGDSCPAANGPGIVYGIIPDNMKCAGLGDSCPAANGPGKMFGTPNNMKCAGLGDPCPAPNGPGKCSALLPTWCALVLGTHALHRMVRV